MYGAARIYSWLRCAKKRFEELADAEIIPIRIGFHDQSNIQYFDRDGSLLASKMFPSHHVEEILNSLNNSTVLIVDDNVGYGTTMTAARKLVENAGGQPFVRCTETAWHLFDRDDAHNISDIVDFPSLRSNVHHKTVSGLISCLAQSTSTYLDKSSGTVDINSINEIFTRLEKQRKNPNWSDTQISWLEEEYAFLAERTDDTHINWGS